MASSSSGAHSMDDINRLLYLDAVQRATDNQHAIKQQVEEAFKNYQKRYRDYASLYSRYVALIKKASTRKVLLHNQQIAVDLSTAEEDINCIEDKLNNEITTAYVNSVELVKLKTKLNKLKKYENVGSLRGELVELKKCTEAIHKSIETIEAGLDNGIVKALDVCAEQLDMTNFPILNNITETTSEM